ncbi:MAG: DUF6460 domain-containing protein [Pseudomonadota bacterium]
MSRPISRFFGGPPLMVLVRLAVLSLVVGVILSVLDLSPFAIWDRAQALVVRIWNMGFDAIELVGEYLVLGAIVVLPIWLISRLFSGFRRSE